MNWDIHVGDCVEWARQYTGEPFHAMLTDPPCELIGKSITGQANCISSILLDFVFPHFDDLQTKLGSDLEFSIPRKSVSLLDDRLGSVGVETGIGVPERSVHFQHNVMIGQEEIERAGEASERIPNNKLWDESVAESDKFFGYYAFEFADSSNPTFCNSLCSCFGKASASNVTMPVIITFPSQNSDSVGTSRKSGASFDSEFVGFSDNALRQSQCASAIVAYARTECLTVLTLDFCRATGELRPADCTDDRLRFCQIGSTQYVGTGARTGRLPSEFKAFGFCLVDFSTVGTFTLYLHASILQRFSHKVNIGGFMGKGWDFVQGVELSAEYAAIGEARLKHYTGQTGLFAL